MFIYNQQSNKNYPSIKILKNMKKILIISAFLTINFFGGDVFAQQFCGTDEHTAYLYQQNPQLKINSEKLESDFQNFIKNNKNVLTKNEQTYVIPVVVHVFHNNGSENISDAQIQSTIAGMNQYFAGTDPGVSLVRDIFKPLIANCKIEFKLAKKDPDGNCTNGIVRVYTPETNRGGENIKKLSTWDTRRYMNIWVTSQVYSGVGNAVGGFAYLPFGGFSNIRDGVIVGALQSFGPGADNTVAHEAGHWLGLFHPFQGDSCAIEGDGIDDTPPTYFKLSTSGVNTGRGNQCNNPKFNTCANDTLPDMQENIMDYFGGSCSGTIFTPQQKAKMRFCLENYRRELWREENLVFTGLNVPGNSNCAPIAAFNTKTPEICAGGNALYLDYSYNATATAWEWTFPGGNPGTFTGKSPGSIAYANPGKYDVILKVTGANGSNTTTLKDYITVKPASTDKKPGRFTYADWWYMNNFESEGWKFDYEFSSNKFVRTGVSYDNVAGMMLPADPFNQKNSFNNNFSVISPAFDFTGTSNPFIALNYSFARGTIYTPPVPTEESLTIFTSTDCGKTWIARATKTAANISTIGSSATLANTVSFVPSEKSKWGELIFQGSSFPKSANVMFKIAFKYAGGNNFYIDNIRVGDGNATSINKEIAEQISLNIAPNPFSSSTSVSYSLNQNSHVLIKVLDILGKEVAMIKNETEVNGAYQVNIDKNTYQLKQGIYFLHIEINGQLLSSKIVVQ